MYQSVGDDEILPHEGQCYECGGYVCADWCPQRPDAYKDYEDEDYDRG